MKRYAYWLCSILFLLSTAAAIWFLHLFVQSDSVIQDNSLEAFPACASALAFILVFGMFLLSMLVLWLTLTCALISVYRMARSYIEQHDLSHQLQLKNALITENYHNLENQMIKSSEIQHEIRHHLMALDCLYQKKDFDGMAQLLSQLLKEQNENSQVSFTANKTLNTILYDASQRAKRSGIRFQALVSVPENLAVPESDLCILLMNMLDNALEGAEKNTPPAHGYNYVFIRIKMVSPYLTIKCENSFGGEIKKDRHGNLLSSKKDSAAHGFGCRQMKEIAGKYQSTILFQTGNGDTFVAQTALRIPGL